MEKADNMRTALRDCHVFLCAQDPEVYAEALQDRVITGRATIGEIILSFEDRLLDMGEQPVPAAVQAAPAAVAQPGALPAANLELEARLQARVTLWQKMSANNKGAPPQWLSTHPSGSSRIAEIEKNLPRVMPLYERALAGQK